MLLSAVLSGCSVVHTRGNTNVQVSGITLDSRRVAPGVVFVAIRGLKTDGNRFVPQAISSGAVAVVSALPGESYPGTPWIQVTDERSALATLAANFNERPAEKLHAIGITGTNGKTTTTRIVESMLQAAGFPCAVFGTIDYRGPGFRLEAERTTPEAPDLQALFKRVVEGGWKYAVMEVSSHAIELKRVAGLRFEVAAFTNLTRDHLDLHKDMRSYFLAKKRLFTGLDGTVPRVLVLNADDPHFEELKAIAPSRVVSYGMGSNAGIFPVRHSLAADLTGLDVVYASPLGELQLRTSLLGKPNLYNIGAAIGVAAGLGIPVEAIRQGVSQLEGVPGRFELVQAGQPFRIVVDYAHTDDALTRLLDSAREITPGRVLVVFGCGGDRDRTKRPLMGEAAARASDFAIATSDNPRSEDPVEILREVEPGLQRAGGVEGKTYRMVPDRREAIRMALQLAQPGDTVLLAGKGHEAYQIVGDKNLPFDDREVARELLDELATGRNR